MSTKDTHDRQTAEEQRLDSLWAELCDLDSAARLLEWDQETGMPHGGGAGRARSLSTLAGLHHRLLTADALADAVAACAALVDSQAAGEDAVRLAAKVRQAGRAVTRARKIPERLTRELASARSAGVEAWREAREADDFKPFRPALERLVDLRREQAACLRGPSDASASGEVSVSLYDALLDTYEPGAREAELTPLFARLREELAPLVRAVVESGITIDESCVRGHFPAAGQRQLGERLAAAIGFDFTAGRLDASAHPFCIGIGPGDVRMTHRFEDDDFRPGVLGILHEAGHGTYEQGVGEDLVGTPIGEAVSVGIHETQSRLWENHVGRSRGFWTWALPIFEQIFPGRGPVDRDAFHRALHVVAPSLIRTEADEVTYNLHILVRYELERALVAGDLEAADLPVAWDDLYAEVLGVRAERLVDGVLQDIHWAMGEFGYFPTYTLGNLGAAQLFAAAGRELGDLEEHFAAGRLAPLAEWLREHVHAPGATYLPGELLERATGIPLSPDALLTHLRRTVEEVYGV